MAAEMNLVELIERFGDEDKCRTYLERLRWPDGVVCPRCDSTKIAHVTTRNQFSCKANGCGYRFSVRAGTIFQDSKLSLTKWFLAIYIIGESKKGVSGHQLSRMLKVTTKTGWFLTHRIRAAMPAYLGEIAFRFNNRENPYLFRDTLIALLNSEALTYETLIAEAG